MKFSGFRRSVLCRSLLPMIGPLALPVEMGAVASHLGGRVLASGKGRSNPSASGSRVEVAASGSGARCVSPWIVTK